jgi:hypothetical protein
MDVGCRVEAVLRRASISLALAVAGGFCQNMRHTVGCSGCRRPLPVRPHLCWWRGKCGAWAAGLRLSRSGRSALHGVFAGSADVAAAHNSMSAAPTCCDIITLSCRRYKHRQGSSKRLLIRGLVFCYEAVRDWEAKLTQILSDELRQRRHRNRSTAVSDIPSATQETVRAAPSSG